MKKILSIALIAVLCLATVSATEFQITGNATIAAGYDIDDAKLTLLNSGKFANIEIVAKKTLHSGSVEKKGESNVYAAIKAALFAEQTTRTNLNTIEGSEGAWTTEFDADGYQAVTAVTAPNTTVIKAQILEAYISNDTWKLNILGVKDGKDFAVSAIDDYKEGGKTKYVTTAKGEFLAKAATQVYGVTFSSNIKEEDKNITASFGAQGENTSTSALQAGMIELPVIKAGNNVSIETAASIVSIENINAKTVTTYVAPSAGVTFENDDVTVKASVDAELDVTADSSASLAWDLDAAAQIALAKPAVTIDAYYAKDTTGITAAQYQVENLLSAQASYTQAIKVSDKSVDATFTATGKDLINSQDLKLTVAGSYDKIEASVYGGYVIATEAIQAGASCKYTADKYVVSAAVDYVEEALTVEAAVSSDKWVDGATLSCGYTSGDLLSEKFGKVEAKCVIAF